MAKIAKIGTVMAAPLRSEVLNCFRRLHRTRRKVFGEDSKTLEAARVQINTEFRKHMKISSTDAVSELVKFGNQVEEVLRTTVVQIRPKNPTTYEARLTKDTYMFNNVPYKG